MFNNLLRMKNLNRQSRREMLKKLAAVPAIPAAMAGYFGEPHTPAGKFQRKFKLSLNLYSFNNLLQEGAIDLFDMLDFCAAHNFDAIDPTGYYFPGYPKPPEIDFINRFKRKAFLLGLDISGTGVRNDFVNPDVSARKADIQMVKSWIEAAAALGIPNVRIFAGTSHHDGSSRNEAFEWLAAAISECCMYGSRYGVMIALQNHNDFLYTADDVNRIFEMVGSEWLGLNLDIGSYRQNNPYSEIEKNIRHAVTWQIKENVWIDGKETPTDFNHLLTIIKNAGYRGYLPLETLGEGDPYKKVPALLLKVSDAINTFEE